MFKGLCRLTGVVVLVCSTVSTALGADSGKQVYTGTLGNSPIVLEVNTYNGDGRERALLLPEVPQGLNAQWRKGR